jgi:hypothetical protein
MLNYKEKVVKQLRNLQDNRGPVRYYLNLWKLEDCTAQNWSTTCGRLDDTPTEQLLKEGHQARVNSDQMFL